MAQTLKLGGVAHPQNDSPHKVLPAGAKRFLYDRMMEIAGFFLAIGVAAIAIALFSYTPSDPSLNNATVAEPTNPLGEAGAIAADLLIQVFGIAGYLPLVGFGIERLVVVLDEEGGTTARRPARLVSGSVREVGLVVVDRHFHDEVGDRDENRDGRVGDG